MPETPEDRARKTIDELLGKHGRDEANVPAGKCAAGLRQPILKRAFEGKLVPRTRPTDLQASCSSEFGASLGTPFSDQRTNRLQLQRQASVGEMHSQPTDPAEILDLYARLIEEIKRRVEVIQRVVDGQVAIPKMAVFELCYLQLRKICEAFALACLAAHGDIPEVHSNRSRDSALSR